MSQRKRVRLSEQNLEPTAIPPDESINLTTAEEELVQDQTGNKKVVGRRARIGNQNQTVRRVGRPSNAQLLEKQAAVTAAAAAAAAAAASSAATEKLIEAKEDPQVDVDEQPYAIGHSLVVKYRDGSNRLAKIIERMESSTVGVWQYYIHYNDFNRRMDEWINVERIVQPPSIANTMQINASISEGSSAQNDSQTEEEFEAKTTQALSRLSTVADLDHDEHEGLDEASLLEHEQVTKIKNIRYVQLGKYIMECWYFSPFPKEYYPNGHAEYIYFCEFSMRFFRTKEELIRYQSKSSLNRYPPGNEIYRDDKLSMFEIDGAIEKIYCQNLSYFAKLFLDHKTLYWDVDVFLFYVLCTRDERGYHPVGYFSKEKYSDLGYNLACILTFPCMQRQGYGRFLIEFSYELSKKEEKVGSPEKPLSDLGALGFRSYWANTILKTLKNSFHGNNTNTTSTGNDNSRENVEKLSIFDITCMTSILPEDIVSTLTMLGLLILPPGTSNASEIDNNNNNNNNNNNASAGSGGLADYVIYAPFEVIDNLLEKYYPDTKLKVDSDKLHWAPFYVMDVKKDKWSITNMRAKS